MPFYDNDLYVSQDSNGNYTISSVPYVGSGHREATYRMNSDDMWEIGQEQMKAEAYLKKIRKEVTRYERMHFYPISYIGSKIGFYGFLFCLGCVILDDVFEWDLLDSDFFFIVSATPIFLLILVVFGVIRFFKSDYLSQIDGSRKYEKKDAAYKVLKDELFEAWNKSEGMKKQLLEIAERRKAEKERARGEEIISRLKHTERQDIFN